MYFNVAFDRRQKLNPSIRHIKVEIQPRALTQSYCKKQRNSAIWPNLCSVRHLYRCWRWSAYKLDAGECDCHRSGITYYRVYQSEIKFQLTALREKENIRKLEQWRCARVKSPKSPERNKSENVRNRPRDAAFFRRDLYADLRNLGSCPRDHRAEDNDIVQIWPDQRCQT